ncbi:DUF1801 domain-containing protein [Flavobacterium suncheonense]|uniref:YdhG-like domain-containing protein n=1 Tax=Flavobacterium suncheonense GH29-5 = DSM 17707 TaxID=1121899 RepID=A0A0A2MB94_9FLAO|nr:DUF1801 domain-containing protein [Flavobacterium suncheonense]KGO89962.1 hypothetical protein Q764_04965 [Flavobacterium suncheonense GH29-5 = DSM 17707]
MQSSAKSTEDYLDSLPDDRKPAMEKLRNTIVKNLPKGFEETMSYGMLGWVVPHSMYPKGYHCDPKLPLPFLSIASQKNFIAVYHMGIYSDSNLLNWFTSEYPKHVKTKLDMGKSCIRFKKPDLIPFELIGELVQKMSPADWILKYEEALNKGFRQS